jgi:hypothetical protein
LKAERNEEGFGEDIDSWVLLGVEIKTKEAFECAKRLKMFSNLWVKLFYFLFTCV